MENNIKFLEDLLKSIIVAIVNRPEKVKIHITNQEDEIRGLTTTMNIEVAKEDIPLCIGAGGGTAGAVRRIIMLAGRKIKYERALFVRVDAPHMPKNYFDV